MNITLLQTDIVWADKEANLKSTESALQNLYQSTDLLVLPEVFSTGFCVDRLDLAETMDGHTISKLREWAKLYRVAITGSFIAKEDGKIYNRAFFVFPDGKVKTVDKRHLFSLGGEHKHFSSGNNRLIVNYCGFNICLMVCYDVRFPVWSRNRNNEYDLIIYLANFPHARMDAWDALLKARAIENQAFVCGINRVGTDGNGVEYSGHSVLLNFKGKTLIDFPEYKAMFETREILRDELDDFREKYPFWKDADDFEILNI